MMKSIDWLQIGLQDYKEAQSKTFKLQNTVNGLDQKSAILSQRKKIPETQLAIRIKKIRRKQLLKPQV